MKLSKNFTLNELVKSNTATRLGISNTPDKEGIIKLRLLVGELLQPIRDIIGPIRVTSGYRSRELNYMIGSSNNSQHTKCEAIDIQHYKRGKMNNLVIYNTIINRGLEYDQCILEFGDSTETDDPTNPAWIHLSYKATGNRRDLLVAYKDKNNKTKYRKPNNYYN